MKLELQRLRQCADYNLAVCVLASGSKGNAIYISDGFSAILIDAGLSATEIIRRLKSRGLNPKGLTGKSVHEIRTFNSGLPFEINNLTVLPFAVSHDAADPVGFTIAQNGSRIGVATDLGTATPNLKETLKQCHLLILEANHDPDMLITGPYPWYLKRRIRSRSGHLSNGQSKRLLMQLQHQDLEHVILAHLSQTNNAPQKVLAEISGALTRCKPRLTVASQHRCGEVIYLK
ncbi:MAG: MBL fold metallo-hydrolase [Deltaproteobacteria bacterium]